MTGTPGRWHACHGFDLSGTPIATALTAVNEAPPRTASLEFVDDAGSPTGRRLWRLDWPADAERPALSEELWQDADGAIWAGGAHPPAVRIDPAGGTITLERCPEGVAAQVLSGLVLPLLAQRSGALLLHACAATRGGEATVICAASGAGKSSLVVALGRSGWQILAEDVVVLTWEDGRPLVWPAAPFVRLRQTDAVGLERRHILPWKDAWDVTHLMASGPSEVTRLAFPLAPPDGPAAATGMSTATTIAELSRHAIWYGDPSDSAARLFSDAVTVASRVPATGIAIPRSPGWRDVAVRMIDELE